MPKISRISTTNIVLMIDQFNDKDEDKRVLELRETKKKIRKGMGCSFLVMRVRLDEVVDGLVSGCSVYLPSYSSLPSESSGMQSCCLQDSSGQLLPLGFEYSISLTMRASYSPQY